MMSKTVQECSGPTDNCPEKPKAKEKRQKPQTKQYHSFQCLQRARGERERGSRADCRILREQTVRRDTSESTTVQQLTSFAA